MFRRPLPIGNLRFLSTINWDGRVNPASEPDNIRLGLISQSNGATVSHAQALAPIPTATRELIADWELGLHHAQVIHEDAGWLDRDGAMGGVANLLSQPFTLWATSGTVFTLFDLWARGRQSAKREIADGQRVFNAKTFGRARTTTCSICHNTPNVGSSATIRSFDIKVSDPERRKPDQIRGIRPLPLDAEHWKVRG